jgi:hypothetical protein
MTKKKKHMYAKKNLATKGVKVTCPNGPKFSFFWGKGGGARLLLFPLCSHHIPQHVSNSSSLHPIFFALSSTLENLCIQPKGGDYNASILRLFKA